MATAQFTVFPLCYHVFSVKIKLNGHLKLLLAYRKAITGTLFSFLLGICLDNTREINQFSLSNCPESEFLQVTPSWFSLGKTLILFTEIKVVNAYVRDMMMLLSRM